MAQTQPISGLLYRSNSGDFGLIGLQPLGSKKERTLMAPIGIVNATNVTSSPMLLKAYRSSVEGDFQI